MFVLTTVTRDCKNGDLYVSVDDNAYLTKEAASTALRARYEDFLKNVINHVADILDALGFTATTGYYDPVEDKKANISDKLTGYYYCDM